MNKAFNILKKSVKVAGVVCVAAGAVALLTSGTAAMAVTEGINHTKNAIKKVLSQEDEKLVAAEEACAQQESGEIEAAEE